MTNIAIHNYDWHKWICEWKIFRTTSIGTFSLVNNFVKKLQLQKNHREGGDQVWCGLSLEDKIIFTVSTWHFKSDLLVHSYTFYDHKNSCSSLNIGVRQMVQNKILGDFTQSEYFLSNFYFCEKLSTQLKQNAKLGLTPT